MSDKATPALSENTGAHSAGGGGTRKGERREVQVRSAGHRGAPRAGPGPHVRFREGSLASYTQKSVVVTRFRRGSRGAQGEKTPFQL